MNGLSFGRRAEPTNRSFIQSARRQIQTRSSGNSSTASSRLSKAWQLLPGSFFFLAGPFRALIAPHLQVIDRADLGDLAAPVFDQYRIQAGIDRIGGTGNSDPLRELKVLAWRAHGNQVRVIDVRPQYQLILPHRLPVVVVPDDRDVINRGLGVLQVALQLRLVVISPRNPRAAGRDNGREHEKSWLQWDHVGRWVNSPTGKCLSTSASRTVIRLPVRVVGTIRPSKRFFNVTGSANSFGSSTTVAPQTLSPKGASARSGPSSRRYSRGAIVTASIPSLRRAKAQTLAAYSPVTRNGRYSPSRKRAG